MPPGGQRSHCSTLEVSKSFRPRPISSRLLKKGTPRRRGPVGCGTSRKEAPTHDGHDQYPGCDVSLHVRRATGASRRSAAGGRGGHRLGADPREAGPVLQRDRPTVDPTRAADQGDADRLSVRDHLGTAADARDSGQPVVPAVPGFGSGGRSVAPDHVHQEPQPAVQGEQGRPVAVRPCGERRGGPGTGDRAPSESGRLAGAGQLQLQEHRADRGDAVGAAVSPAGGEGEPGGAGSEARAPAAAATARGWS